jgi:hypothetical protein
MKKVFTFQKYRKHATRAGNNHLFNYSMAKHDPIYRDHIKNGYSFLCFFASGLNFATLEENGGKTK